MRANFHQQARIQDIEIVISGLEEELDTLINRVIPSAQSRLEDVREVMKKLNIEKAEINLSIAKQG